MAERWLQTNRRVASLTLTAAVVFTVLTLALLLADVFPFWLATGMVSLGAIWTCLAVWQLVCPRVGYRPDYLLLRLRGPLPIRVPIDVVECFFLGQGSVRVSDEQLETSNLVVRLAESEKSWHRVRVSKSLARWCDGYVTIRGLWCEPLSIQVVNRMNRRLAEVKRLSSSKSRMSSPDPPIEV